MPDQSLLQCPCLEGDLNYPNFENRDIGSDGGPYFADVTVRRCKRCGRNWLDYLVEYEQLSGSGRWVTGVLTDEMAAAVTAESARKILESLDWYFLGGSAFFGCIYRSSGSLEPYLLPAVPIPPKEKISSPRDPERELKTADEKDKSKGLGETPSPETPPKKVFKEMRELTEEEWKRCVKFGQEADDAQDQRLLDAMEGRNKKKP